MKLLLLFLPSIFLTACSRISTDSEFEFSDWQNAIEKRPQR
jgi:hypothetical protein